MLSVIKQKVNQDESTGSLSGSSLDTSSPRLASASLSASHRHQEKTVIFTHIPGTVSLGSQTPQSSDSSVSSYGIHAMQPITRNSSDETSISAALLLTTTCALLDSQSESSNQKGKEEIQGPHLSRKVSDTNLDAARDNGEAAVAGPPAKKARVDAEEKAQPTSPTVPPLRLLGTPKDESVLSPLHAFVRMQIEVFTATAADIAQPSPGRKTPIKLNQVGLRCIHCRELTARDRVKRAVCYPTSTKRVYNSVSDMKFDHFTSCRGMPAELRAQFTALKGNSKKRGDRPPGGSSSSTAQYYHDTAQRMGMVDDNGVIYMSCDQVGKASRPSIAGPSSGDVPTKEATAPRLVPSLDSSLTGTSTPCQLQMMQMFLSQGLVASASQLPALPVATTSLQSQEVAKRVAAMPTADALLLASPLDPQYLNSIHCFVRRNVEVFEANKEDISAPSPGRKNRIVLGQVGIRCLHCAKLPHRDRVKRAVCYPPSVNSIYHSVSNMKFDHYKRCKGLSEELRTEFTELRAASTGIRRGGAGGASNNSTAQYYHDSAQNLGLMDTPKGIRLGTRCPASGINALVIAATNRAEYERQRSTSSVSV